MFAPFTENIKSKTKNQPTRLRKKKTTEKCEQTKHAQTNLLTNVLILINLLYFLKYLIDGANFGLNTSTNFVFLWVDFVVLLLAAGTKNNLFFLEHFK